MMKSSLLRLVAIICILQLFSSCRTVRVVEQVPVHDTLHVYHTDSLHTTDSVIVERQTTIRVADSALLAELGLKLKDNEQVILVMKKEIERLSSNKESVSVDTTYVYKEVPVEVTIEKEVEKPFPLWSKILMVIGGICIVALAAVGVYKLKKMNFKTQ